MLRVLPVLLAVLVQPAPGGIAWQGDLDKALEKAAAEKKVVFLAVNMDGEKANERMVAKVYTDREIVELSGRTLNLVASAAEHAPGDKPCPRFPGVTCKEHRTVDTAARHDVLKSDDQGLTVAPQSVFLGPDGKVILSVPYEVDARELAWCFVTALTRNDPDLKLAMPERARMPRRLVLGGVHDPKTSITGALMAPTKKELDELIKTLRKGTLEANERITTFARVLMSEEPEALDFVQDELRSGGFGPLGGGGGGGGKGGGGGAAGARGGGGSEKHRMILHAIGMVSPSIYWKLAADSLEEHEASIRAEAAVALEQLAVAESTKVLLALLAKEEDPTVAKEMLRALGATGAADPKVHALLVKRARTEKNELLRLNAILALGACDPDPEIRTTLQTLLSTGTEKERTAAACAAALSRDATWLSVLEPLAATATDAGLGQALAAAITVLKGGEIRGIRETVVKIGSDKIQRERLFGRVKA